ncbi:alpha/beta-hydrolase [Melanomma pulvis-pyrius CBS 109.77]|uniref:Alpha/beta-hydrolase n=1 Tax=Melanomma pulvis-pyrius CBS 109.77 TaxID=1314802 RepID=A0A6A6XQT8_9PLEO|nr:alpha/beta-hydrolase [Melanomma pulvis-pyrius CBS 109.77]
MVYDHQDLTPSKELNWVPCFDSFTCTYLTVPLDYKDPSAGETDIAFIKYTGANSTGQEILYNPGGPSSSGVVSLIHSASGFAEIFGDEYDFVSFDPRGVNNSGPAVSCFPTIKERDDYDGGSSGSTPLAEQYQSTKALGEYCTQVNLNTTAKYVGTSAVVQDMMHYTELVATTNGQDPAEAKIWYYGISYGTVIGHTLATMYPDRIGRIIVDGNVYSYEHYQGLQTNTVDDCDHAFKFFFDFCYEAGELCPFNGNASSVAEIETRYRALLKSLEDSPPIYPGSTYVVKRYEFENWAFGKMYAPTWQFAELATAAANLEAGNITAFWPSFIAPSKAVPAGLKGVPTNANYTGRAIEEAMALIMAADVVDRYPIKTFADYMEVVQSLRLNSYYGSTTIGNQNALIANGLVITPPESQHFPGFKITNTLNPILFIGTTGDPITPMSSAFKMSAYFPGSVVLTQDSPGHSFDSAKSNCTRGYARAYLADASLPPVDTVCASDLTALDYFKPATQARRRGMERRGLY